MLTRKGGTVGMNTLTLGAPGTVEDKVITAIRACATHYQGHPVPVTARSRPTCRGQSISESQYTAWRAALTPSERTSVPSPRTIRETFGSWNAAKAAAGLTANTAPRTDYSTIRATCAPTNTGQPAGETTVVTAQDAQAAITAWRTWQDDNLDLAPTHYEWRQGEWRRSMSEYDTWRAFIAHGAPTIDQLRTATCRTWTELRDGDPTWPAPTPAQYARLHGDHTPDGSFTLRVELLDVPGCGPATLTVDATLTWAGLHAAIQDAMGWEDAHLYSFERGWFRARHMSEFDEDGDDETLSDPIGNLLSVGTTITYMYDFGDQWVHEITVIAASPDPLPATGPETARDRWQVIQHATGTPPEDCGGSIGWHYLTLAAADPSSNRHAEAIEWVGRDCACATCTEDDPLD